jgi:hypothetical protein
MRDRNHADKTWPLTWRMTVLLLLAGLLLALRIQKALELKTLAATSHG